MHIYALPKKVFFLSLIQYNKENPFFLIYRKKKGKIQ